MRVRGWAGKVPAIAGLLLAGLLAAGCASAASEPAALVPCTGAAVRAIKNQLPITSLPAACQGLTRAQVNAAALDALAAMAGSAHGPRRARAYIQDVRFLLTHPLVKYPVQPAPPPVTVTAPGQFHGPPLALVALVTWVITVGLGSAMMARWLIRGRRRQPRVRAPRRGFSPAMNFAHFGLAVTSLVVWIGYLVTGLAGLAWAGCVLLAPVAGLGMALVAQFFTESTAPGTDPPRGQRPPAWLIAVHIFFAVTTVLLAVLVAVGA
jgi:hypothetical protein